jgi:hypothetical protein
VRIDHIAGDGPMMLRRGEHECRATLSRRHFLRAAAGATVVGGALAKGLVWPALAAAGPGVGGVEPIPETLEFFPGHHFHVQAPPYSGSDSDPSTVFNFRGAAGLAYISGSCQRTDRKTGEVRTLPFRFNDMRFMQGTVRAKGGPNRDATFAFT